MVIDFNLVDFVLKDPREKNEATTEQDSILDFLEFKQSISDWALHYQESKTLLSSTILCTNPNVLEILFVWNKFKQTRLIEIEPVVTKGTFELKTFKNVVTQRLEKAGEKLMTT